MQIETVKQEIENVIVSTLESSFPDKEKITAELTKQLMELFFQRVAPKGLKRYYCVPQKEKKSSCTLSGDGISKVVCKYFKVSPDDVFSLSRKQHFARARQVSMYFIKKHTELSLEKVGVYCGNRHHATVLHACLLVEKMKNTNESFRNQLEDIDTILVKS